MPWSKLHGDIKHVLPNLKDDCWIAFKSNGYHMCAQPDGKIKWVG
tara:strand:- start:311 stop:445 length:135 start_codon:yes stop_codon:yes gene_type:complete